MAGKRAGAHVVGDNFGALVFAGGDFKALRLDVVEAEPTAAEDEIDGDPLAISDGTAEHDVITPQDLPTVDDPFAAPPDLPITVGGTIKASQVEAPEVGLALYGRMEGKREVLLGRHGGTSATEAAVALGLSWLAKQQRTDGSWSLTGPYSDGSQFDNVTAATAMALLAFQGHGNTHEKRCKYKSQVEKGMNFLLRLQDREGNFFHTGPMHSGLYSQAQATIALCELYGMTQDSRLREPAERAIRYCESVQDKKRGGWRDIPGEDSDTSVTGWFVMALQKRGG